jgi:hypothetical protein
MPEELLTEDRTKTPQPILTYTHLAPTLRLLSFIGS